MIRASSFPLTAPANAVRRAHGNPPKLTACVSGNPYAREPPKHTSCVSGNPYGACIRASSFPLTAPANAVRRAQASAEYPFPPRRCINILREGGNGDRKTNYKQKEKPARRLRAGFNLKRRFTMRKSRTEKNALTDNNNHPIRFSVCAASARRPSSLPGL